MFRAPLLAALLAALGAAQGAPSDNHEPALLNIALQLSDGIYYHGLISVGTPEQNISVAFDTSLEHLWIGSASCKGDSCLGKALFNGEKSSSFESNAANNVEAIYHLYPMRGNGSKDKVKIGGASVDGQSIEMLDRLPKQPFQFTNSYAGIVGIGPQSTLLQNMLNKGIISESIVSLYFDSKSGTGEVTLGGVNQDRYDGQFAFVELDSENLWQFPLSQVSLGNGLVDCSPEKPCVAFVGSSDLIGGPSDKVRALAASLGAVESRSGDFILPSCELSKLPEMSFQIGERNYSIKAEQYVVKLEQGDSSVCMLGFEEFTSRLREPMWNLGHLFLQNYYATLGRGKFGLAELRRK